jgi:hypothetical protein
MPRAADPQPRRSSHSFAYIEIQEIFLKIPNPIKTANAERTFYTALPRRLHANNLNNILILFEILIVSLIIILFNRRNFNQENEKKINA